MNKCRVVIVGGGISGLSTAFFLSRRISQEHLPLKITVLEASDRFGGVLRTLIHEDLRMEAGADAFYAGKNDATDLCRELGLREDVIEASPCFRRFFSLKNKKPFLVPGLPGSFFDVIRLLNSPRLNFFTKCRMLCEPFIPRREEGGDESLASFIRRRLGQNFYQTVAKPLVQGVYMMDPERLSLEAMFPRLQQAEKTYGSLAGFFLNRIIKKRETGSAEFFTLKHGLEGLVHALVRELGGCELRGSVPVRQCAYNTGWKISLEDGTVLHADILCLAINASDSSKLLSTTAPGLSQALSNIRYDSIAAVNLIYKSKDIPAWGLGSGFLVPMDGEQYPFSSLKWLGKSADGKHFFLRAFLSEAMIPGVFSRSDKILKQKILTFLNDFFGIRAKPLFINVQRYPNALPQCQTGHLECMARIREKSLQYPGLFFAGNGFREFGITDCIRQARIMASSLRFPIL
ncbi:MAG: protoporphyrinogen oxidase [Candidatus Omnitrophota bacterium]|jgi:oxygen-dependent protoporphyrinogen oxidase